MNNVYFYEHTLSERRHQTTMARIETRLTDLGLSGKIYRLGPMTRLDQAVRDELRKRPSTIIAVGGDALVNAIASFLADSDIPLGILPVEGEGVVASALGISIDEACKTLAARRIIRIDLGRTDTGRIFLGQLSVQAKDPVIAFDNGLTARTDGAVEIQVANVLADSYGYVGPLVSPEDGKLNTYLLKTHNGFLKKDISQSSFACTKVDFLSGPCRGTIDGEASVEGVQSVSVWPQSLSVIVGKERAF
jgi:diacylglycerol kinase family enzyme